MKEGKKMKKRVKTGVPKEKDGASMCLRKVVV